MRATLNGDEAVSESRSARQTDLEDSLETHCNLQRYL
jgi:hypothetical protein